MRILVCIVPSGGIANPAAGASPVAAGSAAAGYFLDTLAIGPNGGQCLMPAGNLTIYAADPNGPAGGIPAGAIAVLGQTTRGNLWVRAVPGWASSLTGVQVQQQPGCASF